MSHQLQSEARKLRALARQFRREGYTVRETGTGDLPEFLEGMRPDLIAEREDDRVIVEVKRAGALRGDNQLKALADRVGEQPGWRFELVTLPEAAEVPSDEVIATVDQYARRMVDLGEKEAALVLVLAMAEGLLRDLAIQSGSRARDWSVAKLAHALVTRGVLDRGEYDALVFAQDWRDRFVHGKTGQMRRGEPKLDNLLSLCKTLRERIVAASSHSSRLGRAA